VQYRDGGDRVARNIARRRAAYHIQDAFRVGYRLVAISPIGYLFQLATFMTKLAYQGYVGSTAYGLLYVTG
jgi:hypothetical protein